MDRQGDAVRKRLQQGQIIFRERLPSQRVHRLDHPKANLIGDQRSREDRTGGEAGLLVDPGVEVPVGGDVIDPNGATGLEDLARYPLAYRHTYPREAFCNLGIAIGEVWEI